MVIIYSDKKEKQAAMKARSSARINSSRSCIDIFAVSKKTIRETLQNDLTFMKSIKWK